MSLNQFFSDLCIELRQSTMPSSVIILFNNILHVKFDGKECSSVLNLDKYHKYKELAHYIVFYSIKHKKRYKSADELCAKLLPQVEIELHNKTIEELMEMATKEYLEELHRIVQLLRHSFDSKEWPDSLLVLVCGPASPRFGHPAMQYFARLTNKTLEARNSAHFCQGKQIAYHPAEYAKYSGRELFYVENAHSIEEALKIGATLLMEKKVMSQYADMSRDILAENSMDYLQKVCKK